MNKKVYNSVAERAGNLCECGCGHPFSDTLKGRPTLDHFWGRNTIEALDTCWMLRWECHSSKGLRFPSKAHWLLKFILFCGKHHYAESAARAQKDIEWDQAKKAVGG